MARSLTPRPVHRDFDQEPRSAPGWPPRAVRNRFDQPSVKTRRELEHDEILMKPWSQFQVNWKLREERRQPIGLLPTRSYGNDHALIPDSREERTRFSHPASSRPYQDTDFANTFDIRLRVGSLPRDRQLPKNYPSYHPPSSLSQNHKTQQRGSSQKVYKDNRGSSHRLSSTSPANVVERFVQGESDRSIAPVQPRRYENTPTRQPPTGPPPESSTLKLHGLTRRPRVQISRERVYRVRGGGWSSVDLEPSQATEMDYSVMSVRPNSEGSGSSFSSRFVHSPTTARQMTIGRSDGGVRHLGASPSLHLNSEPEQPRSRIKTREGASATESPTVVIPSLMNDIEEEWLSSSPISTPKAPPLDQPYVIGGDLQREDERLIAGCPTDPRISFREAAAAEDRRSFEFIRSTSPPLEVSHFQSHAMPVRKGDSLKQPRQRALCQQPSDSDTLRSRVGVHRDRGPGEGIIRQECVNEEEGSIPNTSRGPEGFEQTLHVDVLLAQRVVRDAMWEDEECLGQSCVLSTSECGEEAVDSSSNWLECGLDRKYSTRSVFDWGYA